ncbi:hypothetical protein NUU61_006330 [Penicillium alfredii]|uniref:Mpv17/PMP22 n=1 Tax=Penicillium alfredii TaxID=1506179 RepID=A0A9W9F0R1_9EURO|nr:uncharacterized protein NUU61_006330 [Penicillium alfredii]KAJ5091460.1 hypothetical protein NUU61_006330 [Penicillium alfredii]
MGLCQHGLVSKAPYLIRPRATAPGVRSPLRRVRQPRRYQSSDSAPPKSFVESKAVEEGSSTVNTSASANPQPAAPSSSPQSPSAAASASSPAGPCNTLAAAAGAATTSAATRSVTRSRALGEVIKAGPVGRLGRWYTRVQDKRPYVTQVCSSIIIYFCGDLSAQMLFSENSDDSKAPAQSKDEEAQEETDHTSGYDPWRTVRHLIVGSGSSIPTYNWFMFLHNNFNYASRFRSILTKVVVQQMCFTPVFNTYFFSMHSLLAGASLEETWERVKKALPVSITNSVKLWPAVTAFSFMYVPPQFRNVFSGCIAVCWQTYLCWLNQKAAGEVQAAELAAQNQVSSASHVAPSGSLIPAAGTA